MADSTKPLLGLRLLVVEDQMLVATAICEAIEDCGCIVVGPTGQLGTALELAQDEALDGAVLDVNLAGKMSFPVAELMAGRGLPFVFLTGYGDTAFPLALRAAPRMQKPFDLEDLVQRLESMFANDAGRPRKAARKG